MCKFKNKTDRMHRIEELTDLVLTQRNLIKLQQEALSVKNDHTPTTNATIGAQQVVHTTQNATTINNNVTNNNVQSITYNIFGQEDISFIDRQWVRAEFSGGRSPQEIMVQAFREAYCDQAKPENFSVYMPNTKKTAILLVRAGDNTWRATAGLEAIGKMNGGLYKRILDRQPSGESVRAKVETLIGMESGERPVPLAPFIDHLRLRPHGLLPPGVVKAAKNHPIQLGASSNAYTSSARVAKSKGLHLTPDPEITETVGDPCDQTVGGDDDFMDGIQAQFGRVTPAVLPPPEKKNEPENTLRFGCELLGVSELLGALAESKGSDERALQRMIRSLWGSGRTLRAGKLPGEVRLLRPGGIWETSSILEVVSVLFDKIHATGEGVRLLTAQPRWLSTVGDWWPEL
jgi:hypothetical protein